MIRTRHVRFSLFILLVAGWGGLWPAVKAAAAEGTASASKNTPKFELDILPLLTARGCNSGACHGKARGQNGFALSLLGFDPNSDFLAIVRNSRGRRLSRANPRESLLLLKATGNLPHGGGQKITVDSRDYEQLLAWISRGVPRVGPEDPSLESLLVLPEPTPLMAGEERSLQVLATYSDGTTRDVTDIGAYHSNEPTIVSVDPRGAVKAGRLPGEATIMVRFMDKIATWSTLVPNPQAVAADVYAKLPRGHWIDELVYRKLAKLNVLPSRLASDPQFMRRLYLDAVGRLPRPDEVRDFLKDSSPNKREQLVERVLELPDYADFWANKWADLLRPNPYRVGIKATLSLDGWLREVFRRNLPYDQFLQELVTAQGSTWRNGATTIYRDRREPAEITTMISQLFLGVRLECAKCHQHPFEVYGQKDFYSLAAFFSRVGYKGKGISPPISGSEEIVLVKSKGEVRHPLSNEVLSPMTLTGERYELVADEDPREQLARWMLAPDNPYVAQVAVNRLWAEVMGVGLVDPVDDFRATNPASNPELLDSLAAYFRQVGFDNKQLLKAIFTSGVYGLSSEPDETNVADHRNYSRHYRKRMRAEVLSDAISDAIGQAEEFEGMPPGTRATQLWTHRLNSELLDAFGRPDPNQDPPCERTPDVTMGQALHLMNAPRIHQRLTQDGGRCQQLAASNRESEEIIEELYLSTFSRFPTAAEAEALGQEFVKAGSDRLALVEDLLWSLINSPEFLYID
jgi:hypothetical protein